MPIPGQIKRHSIMLPVNITVYTPPVLIALYNFCRSAWGIWSRRKIRQITHGDGKRGVQFEVTSMRNKLSADKGRPLAVAQYKVNKERHIVGQQNLTHWHRDKAQDFLWNNNQLDATKCWFIYSTCFEHYYAHPQEYITEYRFLVSKPVIRLGCVAQSC
jgi:hypothetical protein